MCAYLTYCLNPIAAKNIIIVELTYKNCYKNQYIKRKAEGIKDMLKKYKQPHNTGVFFPWCTFPW